MKILEIIVLALVVLETAPTVRAQCDSPTNLIPPAPTDGSPDVLTASSLYHPRTGPQYSRLDTVPGNGHQGAWCAGTRNSKQWIQVDLEEVKTIESVITQGRAGYNQWVTSYSVSYSEDGSTWTFVQNGTENVVFDGNSDQSTKVENTLDAPITARYVRLHPVSWFRHISLRWDLTGCSETPDASETPPPPTTPAPTPLSLCDSATGLIPPPPTDGSPDVLTASSLYHPRTGPQYSRLDTVPGNGHQGAWSAGVKNANQWIQVDLGDPNIIESVITQGRAGYNQWVTSYSVSYSEDGSTWTFVQDNGENVVFDGNSDQNTKVENKIFEPFTAQYVRLHPVTWHGGISLRWDLTGCSEEDSSSSVADPLSTYTPMPTAGSTDETGETTPEDSSSSFTDSVTAQFNETSSTDTPMLTAGSTADMAETTQEGSTSSFTDSGTTEVNETSTNAPMLTDQSTENTEETTQDLFTATATTP